MSNETTRPTVGQDTTDPSSNPLTEILTLLRGIGTRLDILEQRFEYLDRDVLKAIDAESEAVTDADPDPPHIPTLALTSDGRLLIAVHYLSEEALAGRETWTGVILTEAEACDVLDRMSDAADDAAGHIGGAIIARSRKRVEEPEGGAEG
jgi:hypothetical protein